MFEVSGVSLLRSTSVVFALALVGCAARSDDAAQVTSGQALSQQASQEVSQRPTQPFSPDAQVSGASDVAGEPATHMKLAKLSGGWIYAHGLDSHGRYACSIALVGPNAGAPMLLFDWHDGMSGVELIIHKTTWSIPANTQPAVEIVVPGAHPFAGHAIARGQSLGLFLRPEIFSKLFIETTAAGRMQIRFPSGSEPVWTVTTASLPQASLFLQSCVAERRKADGATQPHGASPTEPQASPRVQKRPVPHRHIAPDIPITSM